ncbi:MAG: GNAT family N-acetyltransferase [bacterium]
MIITTRVKDIDKFLSLKDEWNRLLRESNSNNITLTWEWLYTWWKIYGNNRELCIITVYEDGVLVGLAPLLKIYRKRGYFKSFYFNSIEFLASGEDEGHQICSEYLDFIILKGREQEILTHILDYLTHQLVNEWDEIVLPDIKEESINFNILRSYSKENGLRFTIQKTEPCSIAKLPSTWEDFLSSAPSSLRYKINRGRRELEKLNSRYVEVKREDELNQAIKTLIELHQQRWEGKGKPGGFASPQRRAFHQQIIPICLRNGWLKLCFLEIDNTPIGSLYNFKYNNKIYFYQSGIIPHKNKHLRPGLLLHSFGIEEAIKEGLHEYDFLKTGKSEYKYPWTNYTPNLLLIRIAKPGLKNSLYCFIEGFLDYLRKIKYFCERFISKDKN